MAKERLAIVMNALEMGAAFLVKLYTWARLLESATIHAPNVVKMAMEENVAGRDAITPTRLSTTIEKTEEDYPKTQKPHLYKSDERNI